MVESFVKAATQSASQETPPRSSRNIMISLLHLQNIHFGGFPRLFLRQTCVGEVPTS